MRLQQMLGQHCIVALQQLVNGFLTASGNHVGLGKHHLVLLSQQALLPGRDPGKVLAAVTGKADDDLHVNVAFPVAVDDVAQDGGQSFDTVCELRKHARNDQLSKKSKCHTVLADICRL